MKRLFWLLWLVSCCQAGAQVSVLTYHNDNARTGQNTAETVLTPSNVNTGQFGRAFTVKVDGYVYGQPLYVPGVSIPNKGPRNVLYVVTEHDSVYALDADQRAKPFWKVSLLDRRAHAKPVRSVDIGCEDLIPEVGITSTPVIDPVSGTIYVLAKSSENKQSVQKLHALDLATGAEKFGGPRVIDASVPGDGDGSVAGTVSFDPLTAHQRAALLLVDGVVYIAWASHCDIGPYHGWVMGYNATNLQQTTVFNATPDGGQGGIWMGGGGLSADSLGRVYCVTGNGTFDVDSGGNDYGDSILKLKPGNEFEVEEYFTPFNQAELNAADLDLGSSGVVLLPDVGGPIPNLLVTSGKEGTLYLCDRDDMGGYNPTNNDKIVQSLPAAIPGGLFGTPAFWNGRLYCVGNGDVLKAFSVSNGLLSSDPVSQSIAGFDFPGATPSISANGDSDGLVWVIKRNGPTAPGVLLAYDATDLTTDMYNSGLNKKDKLGPAVKFSVPTVANGKVYVGGIKRVDVFGLRAP